MIKFEDGSAAFDESVQPIVSIALSLKRLADAMDARNEFGEAPAEAIGAGIARALRNRD